MRLRVLTWNLLHGRAVPSAGRDLTGEFAAALAGWEWDVALLQEVPPWWPPVLAAAAGGDQHFVLTSRNALLPVRRAIAVRWPDLIRSNGGGANAILVRGDQIATHRLLRLCLAPERRWLHAVGLASGLWVGNLHLTVRSDPGARREAAVAAATMLSWAGGAPVILGGDFNVRGLALEGFEHAGGHDVDMVFAAGLAVGVSVSVLDRGRLSDHAPVVVTLER
jgi:endonuclease/exonuclease/phosphatase family metal-dependent hydrolase